MKLVYHIGMHSTDQDRALQCLTQNADALEAAGTVVASPRRFRPVLREAMLHLRGTPASREIQAQVLDSVMDPESTDRLVFSNDSFLCVPKRAVAGGTLYPLAAERATWIRNLFPDDPAEFVFAIRNPATLIPALQARFAKEETFEAYLERIRPEELTWSDMIKRLRDAVPDCALTIWCNEDAPLIWYDVLDAMTGMANTHMLPGTDAFYGTLVDDAGLAEMRSAFAENPPETADSRRGHVARILAAHGRPNAGEVEYELPGWTADRIARLSERYEADIQDIQSMGGVRFLSPAPVAVPEQDVPAEPAPTVPFDAPGAP